MNTAAARALLRDRPVWDLPTDLGRPVCFLAGCEPELTSWRSHVHKGIELGVVLGGAHRTRIGDTVRTCRTGDTWICATWEPHAWRSLEPDTCVAVLTFLPGAVDADLLNRGLWLNILALPPASRPCPRTPKERDRVLHLASDLYEEMRESHPQGQTAKLLGLWRLLAELERCWRPNPQALSETSHCTQVSDHDRVRAAVELVEAAAGAPVKAGAAARACGLSRSRFHLVFRRAMGVSFHQFCMRARVGIAAHRLLTSDDPVGTVATQLGFADASHLHRNFTRYCGCTPREYRLGRLPLPVSAQSLAIGSLMLSPEVLAMPAAGKRAGSRRRSPATETTLGPSYYRARS